MNDEQLVALCKTGEKQAFEELITRYHLPLNKFFYRLLRDASVCEDLTHEVVIKLIENIERYHPIAGAKFSTWLFKIAYHAYVDYLKQNPSGKESGFDDIPEEPASPNDIDESVWRNIQNAQIRLAVSQLPDEMRSLVVLRYYNDFSYAEIAGIMGINPLTVKWKLHNAIKKLKSIILIQGGVEDCQGVT